MGSRETEKQSLARGRVDAQWPRVRIGGIRKRRSKGDSGPPRTLAVDGVLASDLSTARRLRTLSIQVHMPRSAYGPPSKPPRLLPLLIFAPLRLCGPTIPFAPLPLPPSEPQALSAYAHHR